MFNWKLFVALGQKLQNERDSLRFRDVVTASVAENGWFTPESVRNSVDSICKNMLTEEALKQWLEGYSELDSCKCDDSLVSNPVSDFCIGYGFASKPKNIGVIMAGNIPLVGFFDMMCVLVCGHNCYVKPSSKDRVLIEYIIMLIREISPKIPVRMLQDCSVNLDAVIAMGSDVASSVFKAKYSDIQVLIRGDRSSVAVLNGAETNADIECLAEDIFMYNGLGCRNVSHIFAPQGYDVSALCRQLADHGKRLYYNSLSRKYLNNNRQRRALNLLEGDPFLDGGFFTMRQNMPPSRAISELTYAIYNSVSEVKQYLTQNDNAIQCVVSSLGDELHARTVSPGEAQHPKLNDYPDGIDVIDFITKI